MNSTKDDVIGVEVDRHQTTDDEKGASFLQGVGLGSAATSRSIRQKWLQIERNLRPDDIVIIVEDSIPRSQWRLGRVEEVFPAQMVL